MKYKYSHQEWYKDRKIDIKSNSRSELIEKVILKKQQIDSQISVPAFHVKHFPFVFPTIKKGLTEASPNKTLPKMKFIFGGHNHELMRGRQCFIL